MRFGLADSFGLSAVVVTVAVKVGDGEFLVGLGLAFQFALRLLLGFETPVSGAV